MNWRSHGRGFGVYSGDDLLGSVHPYRGWGAGHETWLPAIWKVDRYVIVGMSRTTAWGAASALKQALRRTGQ